MKRLDARRVLRNRQPHLGFLRHRREARIFIAQSKLEKINDA